VRQTNLWPGSNFNWFEKKAGKGCSGESVIMDTVDYLCGMLLCDHYYDDISFIKARQLLEMIAFEWFELGKRKYHLQSRDSSIELLLSHLKQQARATRNSLEQMSIFQVELLSLKVSLLECEASELEQRLSNVDNGKNHEEVIQQQTHIHCEAQALTQHIRSLKDGFTVERLMKHLRGAMNHHVLVFGLATLQI